MPIQLRHLDQGGPQGDDPKVHSKMAYDGAPASGGAAQTNDGQDKARTKIGNEKGGTKNYKG